MHWVRVALVVLVLARAIHVGGSATLRSSVQVVSVVCVPFDFGTMKDFSCCCCCFILLAYFIFPTCFLPLEWLNHACFPMLLSSKVSPHTIHLALWLSFFTVPSQGLNSSSSSQAELKLVCRLIFSILQILSV